MADRPNVIVVVSDTYRPDHLAVNGHPRAKTPELDAWVSRCVTFDGARVSSFPTIPMRTDWFTGRFGHPRHPWQNLDPKAVTLPQVMGQAGYTTQLIADTTHLLRADFWRPFQHFHFGRGHEGDRPFSRLNEPIRSVVSDRRKVRVETGAGPDRPPLADLHAHTNAWRVREEDSQIAELMDTATRWIEDNHRGGPFLLWLDCFDVHEPWFPPEYCWRMYQPDYEGEPMVHPNYHSAEVYEPDELDNLRARYLGMCTLVSKHVGRLFRLIEDTGLLNNTVVVFMSDHGMYLGERGRTGKTLIKPGVNDCFPFHRELARICWSMHFPPGLGIDNVRRLPQVIQAPDLMPTVLELCGIEVPQCVEGASLVPLLRGETSDPPREINVTASTCHVAGQEGRVHCRMPAVTDGEWTLLLSEPPLPQPPHLYHQTDPTEQHDLFAEHPDEARRLHAKMIEWLRAHDAPPEALERLSERNTGVRT